MVWGGAGKPDSMSTRTHVSVRKSRSALPTASITDAVAQHPSPKFSSPVYRMPARDPSRSAGDRVNGFDRFSDDGGNRLVDVDDDPRLVVGQRFKRGEL